MKLLYVYRRTTVGNVVTYVDGEPQGFDAQGDDEERRARTARARLYRPTEAQGFSGEIKPS